MQYNVKLTFYGEEIQISRYHYKISKKDKEQMEMIFDEDDFKDNKQHDKAVKSDSKPDKQNLNDNDKFYQVRSQRRSKQSIYELVRANVWDYFATFTIAENRYDYDSCKERLRQFLKDFKKRKTQMEYLVVPEQHKDGAWHFHALLKGELADFLSETWHKDRYELVGYKLGKNEVEKVRDTCRVSSYITKYITKELGQTQKNKRRYFYSKGLNKPCVREMLINKENPTIDFVLNNFPEMEITHVRTSEFNGNKIEYIQLRKDTSENF